MVVTLGSCHNCICIPSDGLRLATITFDSTEIDTMIVRKFQKGSNFSQQIDTVQWDRSKVNFSKHNDTFQMASWIGSLRLNSQFDYQVFIPANNRVFTVSEINEPQRTDDCSGKVMCVNVIVSVKLNTTTTSISDDILYLRK